ncbi:MAG: hypothetical protein ACT4PG_12265 [Panacagrimonas sp.]
MSNVNINGDNNIVGNHNTVLMDSAWSRARQEAQTRVAQLCTTASSLERWSYGIFATGLGLLWLAGSWLPAKGGLIAFGVAVVASICAFKYAEAHRVEAQRLRRFYGLF